MLAPVFIVSGLPRSGTSLVMQMLRAGGVPVLEDGARAADEDNPRGYLEDVRTTRLWQDASWLRDARGKAVKIVSPLLPALPFEYDFRVIIVTRNLVEVMASQATMLRRRGHDDAQLTAFVELLDMARYFQRWVKHQANIETLSLGYRDVLDAPADAAARIAAFLGLDLDLAAMAAAVDPSLHRQRHGST